MTSVRLKFRASANPDREGSLVFQVIHRRAVHRIRSAYRIFRDEWDEASGRIVLPPASSPRYARLVLVRFNVEWELQRLREIADGLERAGGEWGTDELARKFLPGADTAHSVFNFIRTQAMRKRRLGRIRCSETYQAALNSFMRFRRGVDLTFGMVDSELMELYEAELRNRGLSRNTTSFYMRILRTNYRLAVEEGLTPDRRPFRHVYCGMDKTVKRCISLAEIRRIKGLDLSRKPALDFARDMFLFSFCTRGMSFVDMAYLRKSDLKDGFLSYRRRKTGQLVIVEWTRQMQEILGKYAPNPTCYLLPIITVEGGDERRQYLNQMMRVNRRLKDVAALAKLPVPLSMYYSRHSWATIARSKHIPLAVISEGLGHDSERTTQIYLDSIRSGEVDRANRKILKEL